MDILRLQGTPAFSAFREGALLANLRKVAADLDIAQVDAAFAYFIPALPESLSAEAESAIRSLLEASFEWTRSGGFFVTPRKGTISPWSSKASDIFHNCGLQAIARVERGIHFLVQNSCGELLTPATLGATALEVLHDRMTEGVYTDVSDLFAAAAPSPLRYVPLLRQGAEALHSANRDWGLALSDDEIDYLVEAYQRLERDPSDAELFMFSQVNSEHCRHKIFNADWLIDGERKEKSLFAMIRNTHAQHPQGCLVAYKDNSGVIEGHPSEWFESARLGDLQYRFVPGQIDLLCKVETHNHPTAIAPFAGAATGVGGEIRDEGATGTGGRTKAGLAAFMVSHLRIPGAATPWEMESPSHPERLATPLDIMLEGPIGGAAFGNEFGRPQLCGLFRTFEIEHAGRLRGYHKPIMTAGGMGNLKRDHVAKKAIKPGALIIQIGGPALKIGIGGGAASSIGAGANAADLDFDSVQRGNPEMQRRCQEVIDGCIALGKDNPMISIHDIGAGGLSNGCPELVEATGGEFELRAIHNEDPSMSPMEIWCCEAQERYVLAIEPASLEQFDALCQRERCPYAVLGKATDEGQLRLTDSHFENTPIDLPMEVLLGKPPKMLRDVTTLAEATQALNLEGASFAEIVDRVMACPTVASKNFLITIADRSITGMVARDQMVGAWQTPVADCAVTTTSLRSTCGEVMSMGERTPLALLDAAASARMAFGEALTNLAATAIGAIGNIKCSANWMAACGEPGEDAKLYQAVKAVGMELCPALGIAIPVGKDSMSMRTRWQDNKGAEQTQSAPLSLLVSAFAPVSDVRKTVTPDLKADDSLLLLLDLGGKRNRLGGSVLAQVFNQMGETPPDLDDPARMVAFFYTIQALINDDLLLAYHDRSDGGLFTTVAEMAFAGRRGADLHLDKLGDDPLAAAFSEELGAVVQIRKDKLAAVMAILANHGLSDACHLLGTPRDDNQLRIACQGQPLFESSLQTLLQKWSAVSYHMQSLRDNPECAAEEMALLGEVTPAMPIAPTYDPEAPFHIASGVRPRIAILREQGINGHNEMAAAFTEAGFDAFDVHMTDLLSGRVQLRQFQSLVACGGFSYGDVLGAGSGWAKSILFNTRLRDDFAAFFSRPDTLSLGVCNGCQMLSQLKDLIPGAEDWPRFVRNRSEQFEARYVSVEILPSPSLFFKGMEGSQLPIPVAHGEGQVCFAHTGSRDGLKAHGLESVRYIDHYGKATVIYPLNPNGSNEGLTGMTTRDGRATILMPHPERCYRSLQMSWRPSDRFIGEAGPWLRMFQNARAAF
jgi:phosphoribosylformylglycinamidine synthase